MLVWGCREVDTMVWVWIRISLISDVSRDFLLHRSSSPELHSIEIIISDQENIGGSHRVKTVKEPVASPTDHDLLKLHELTLTPLSFSFLFQKVSFCGGRSHPPSQSGLM
jgi:hypothetical protein